MVEYRGYFSAGFVYGKHKNCIFRALSEMTLMVRCLSKLKAKKLIWRHLFPGAITDRPLP